MKILFAISSLESGGAERVLSELANHFSRQPGYEVHILTLQTEGTPPFYPIENSVRLHQLGVVGEGAFYLKPFRILKRIWVLRSFLLKINPDSVVSFIDEMNIFVLIASIGMKIRLIISERIDPRYHKIGLASNVLRRLFYPFADLLVVQCNYIKSFFSYMSRKTVVIPNLIRPSPTIYNENHDTKKIISVGRFNRQKDHASLIEAFANISRDYPGWTLDIYGHGPEEEHLKNLIHQYDLCAQVFIQNPFFPIEEKLFESNIFVFPSLFEGFPNALAEALAIGMPVIVSNCEGNLELVQHNDNGLVFPVQNVTILAHFLRDLMENNTKRVMLGKSARASIGSYEPEKIYLLWKNIFEATS